MFNITSFLLGLVIGIILAAVWFLRRSPSNDRSYKPSGDDQKTFKVETGLTEPQMLDFGNGVIITVPDQGRALIFNSLPLSPLPDGIYAIPSQLVERISEIKPPILNLEVKDAETHELVFTFSPPLILKVSGKDYAADAEKVIFYDSRKGWTNAKNEGGVIMASISDFGGTRDAWIDIGCHPPRR